MIYLGLFDIWCFARQAVLLVVAVKNKLRCQFVRLSDTNASHGSRHAIVDACYTSVQCNLMDGAVLCAVLSVVLCRAAHISCGIGCCLL